MLTQCLSGSETRHPDRYDQSDDREGGIGPRVALCCRPPRLRCYSGAGDGNMLTTCLVYTWSKISVENFKVDFQTRTLLVWLRECDGSMLFNSLLTGANLSTGIFWYVPPSLLHLGECDGDKVCDRNVMSDEEGRVGSSWRIGRLCSVHCWGLLHG